MQRHRPLLLTHNIADTKVRAGSASGLNAQGEALYHCHIVVSEITSVHIQVPHLINLHLSQGLKKITFTVQSQVT